MASSNSQQANGPSPETCQSTFETGVALALHLWPALTFAVENDLGGSDGAEKREWFAGSVAELFPSIPDLAKTARAGASKSAAPSHDDLLMDAESRLLQIMDDEFETVVDDGTAYEVAEQILGLWRGCSHGRFDEVDALRRRWEAGKGKKVSGLFQQGKDVDQDTDWDTEDDDEDEEESDEDGDVDMADAPPKKEKPAVEVDEDGFTKVTRKKK